MSWEVRAIATRIRRAELSAYAAKQANTVIMLWRSINE
jgi:hypothetical protein